MNKLFPAVSVLSGLLLAYAQPVSADADKCIELYDDNSYQQAFVPCSEAANNGHAQAQTILGELYDERKDVEQTRYWWEKAAATGYLPARNLLALKYYYGGTVLGKEKGWPQDYARAMRIWKKDAFNDVATAQFMVGEMHLNGKGTKHDPVEAYAWLKLASNNGYLLANDLLFEIGHTMAKQQRDAAAKRIKEYERLIAREKDNNN
ncbi:MAG: tetratricopeptide repeat protein [Gammaproteobacteria bacterium]|nr:tetratricopeptide repeat protein [Gammaproteobacteria bacterium]